MKPILFRFPGINGVSCLFSGLDQGNISFEVSGDKGTTLQNRKKLLAAYGFSVWQELRQVHGDLMIFDTLPRELSVAGATEADAQASVEIGLPLLIKTADCQPIMMAHLSGKHIAAMHVGWRGNRINLPGKGVKALCEHYGLQPADIMAVRGPSLGPKASFFDDFERDWGKDFLPWRDERNRVNLWELTRHQLMNEGILSRHIFSLDLCTYSLPENYFSFRRDKDCGRQASLIWIEK